MLCLRQGRQLARIETRKIERAEAFQLENEPNWKKPSSKKNAPNVGRIENGNPTLVKVLLTE